VHHPQGKDIRMLAASGRHSHDMASFYLFSSSAVKIKLIPDLLDYFKY
jgi:hypothetical protein